eukprot:4266612-Pleurochrysis_carterae.AAC.4
MHEQQATINFLVVTDQSALKGANDVCWNSNGQGEKGRMLNQGNVRQSGTSGVACACERTSRACVQNVGARARQCPYACARASARARRIVR